VLLLTPLVSTAQESSAAGGGQADAKPEATQEKTTAKGGATKKDEAKRDQPAKPLPLVVERYEQLLLRSPGPGTAFDKVYQHFLENEGLDVLDARWQEKAKDKEQAWAVTLVRGILAQRRGRDKEAQAAFAELVELKPDDYRGWVAVADDSFGRGEFKDAAEAMQKAIKLEVPASSKLELYQKLARMQERAFDEKASLETYRSLAKEFPTDPFALEEAGQALLRAEEYDEAKEVYANLLKLAQDDPYRRVTVTMRLAEIDERQDRYQEAIARYEAMLENTSDTSWMHRELRRLIEDIYRRKDDLAGLIEYYEKRLEKHPQDLAATVKLSDVYFELNRKKEGLAALEKAVSLAPDRSELQWQLSKRYLELEQYNTAIDVLKKLQENRPDDARYAEQLGAAYWSLYRAEEKPEMKEKALAAWKAIVPKDNKQARLVLYQAETFQTYGLEEEAIGSYRQAIELDPTNAETRERLASLLWKLKRDEEAAKVLTGLVEGKNKTPENYHRLAKIYRRHDADDKALAAINDGLKLKGDHFDLLALKWAVLADAEKWEETLKLYEPLLAAAPNAYFVHEIENRQIQALSSLNRLEDFRMQELAKLSQDGGIKEQDLRLLLRACLQMRAMEDAETVLAAARERFPDSVPMIRLEADFYRRNGQQDKQVAALKRLISLQPNREAEWLREIAHAHRDAGEWDQALESAQQLISRLPASPEGYLLYADLAFAADKPDEAIAKLRQAIQHSDKPNDVRLRLARYYQTMGKNDEALEVFEEAFEAEEDAAGKITLIKPLTEIYFALGRADELVEKFKHRQLAEQAGARYALYLSAIHTQMQDYTNARKELSRALANRQQDPQLLTQLIRLAEAEGNSNELLRFQRMLTDLEPSVRNKAQLAQALVTNGEMDEAIRLVETNRVEMVENPKELENLVSQADDPEFAAELAALFAENLGERPEDWQGRLLLGDLFLSEGEQAKAQDVYWQVFEMEKDSAAMNAANPLTSGGTGQATSSAASVPALTTISQIYQSPLAQRVSRTPQLRQTATPKIMGRGMQLYHSNFRNRMAGMGMSTGNGNNLEEARDTALVYLALLAMNNEREGEFLEKLDAVLDKRKASFEERLVTYSIIESPKRLLRTVKEYLDHPEQRSEAADQFCTMLLMSYSGRNQQEEIAKEVEEYLDALYARLEEASPGISIDVAMSRFQLLQRMGKRSEAEKVAFEALREFKSSDPVQIRSAYNLALMSNQLVMAEDLLSRMLADKSAGQFRHQVVHMAFSLASRLYDDPVLRDRALELTERLLEDVYRFQQPVVTSGMTGGGPSVVVTSGGIPRQISYRYSSRHHGVRPLHYQQGAPGINELIGQMQLNWFNQIFNVMRTGKNKEALFEIFDKQEKELPDDQKIYPQLARAYAQWTIGDKDKALAGFRKVRQATGDDSIRLNEAAILFTLKRYKEALAQLKEIPADAGDLYVDAQFWMMAVAKQTKDKDLARKVAKDLEKTNLPLHLRMTLAQELNNMQLREEAKAINKAAQKQARSRQPRYTPIQRMERELSKLNKPDEMDKAVQVARRILAQNPMAPNQQQAQGARRNALRKLKQADQLEAYIAELEELAGKSPTSPRFELLLGEAKTETDKDAALVHFEKACELRPRDVTLHLKVADVLDALDRDDEALEVYRKLLEIEPVAVLQQRSSQVIQAYKQAERMKDLVELCASFPNFGRLPGMHSPLQGFFQSFGRELKRNNQLDLAVQVWKQGLEHSHQANLSQCQMIVDALLEDNRQKEAAEFLHKFLFPGQPDQDQLFVMSSGQNANQMQSYLSHIHFNGSRVSSPLLDMILAIRDPEASKMLYQAIHEQTQEEPDNWHAQVMDTMLQVQRGRSGAAAKLEKLLGDGLDDQSGLHSYHKVNVLRLFASKLLETDKHKEMGLKAMERAAKFSDEQPTNYSNRVSIRLELARAANELGQDKMAGKSLLEVVDIFREQSTSNNRNYNFDQLMSVAEQLVGYGKMKNANEVIAMAESMPHYDRSSTYKKRVGELRSEIDLLSGKLKQPACYAWVESIRPDGTAVINYEVTAPLPDSNRSSYPGYHQLTVRGRNYDRLSGKYSVSLLVGEDENAMSRLVKMDKAPAQGTWKGKLPGTRGYVRTVLDNGKQIFFGDPVPLVPVENLLTNPNFTLQADKRELPGWKLPGSLNVKKVDDGPSKDGSSLAITTGTHSDVRLLGEPIEVEDGAEYVMSGWIYVDTDSNERAQFGLRCLNDEGKQVGEYWARQDRTYMGRKWTWLWQSFYTDKRSLSGAQRLPDKATKIQPVIKINQGARVAEFTLGRLNTAGTSNN